MRRSHVSLALAVAALAGSLPVGTRVVVADGPTPTHQLRNLSGASGKATQSSAPAVPSFAKAGDFDRWWTANRLSRRTGYPDGPGWTNRHVQRMARKRRNQARHRAACR